MATHVKQESLKVEKKKKNGDVGVGLNQERLHTDESQLDRQQQPQHKRVKREDAQYQHHQHRHSSGSSSSSPPLPSGPSPLPSASFSLAPSGRLAAASNDKLGVALKYAEPPDARVPTELYRLYGFKGGVETAQPLRIHRQSCYSIGRDEHINDIPLQHPSISKQHACVQFRAVTRKKKTGTSPDDEAQQQETVVIPYLIDLNSTNGTMLNGIRIEPQRYIELRVMDVLQFGQSSREYVLMQTDNVEQVKEKLAKIPEALLQDTQSSTQSNTQKKKRPMWADEDEVF